MAKKNNNHKKPTSTVVFIFGGSGDLNQRKLTPALYNLFIDEFMPENFAIVGTGRTDYSNEKFRGHLLEGIKEFSRRKDDKNATWESFQEHISYLRMDADNPEDYNGIAKIIDDSEKAWGEHPNVLFYLAVAPQLVPDIATNQKKEQSVHLP